MRSADVLKELPCRCIPSLSQVTLVRAGSLSTATRPLQTFLWSCSDTRQALANFVTSPDKVACHGIFALMNCKSLVNGLEPVENSPGRCWRT